jgi:hypothetical protein
VNCEAVGDNTMLPEILTLLRRFALYEHLGTELIENTHGKRLWVYEVRSSRSAELDKAFFELCATSSKRP